MAFITLTRPSDHVAIVTLNRPERMNAMAFDVMVPLREQIEALSIDNTVRAVVLTGAGSGFCSGADLEDPGDIPNIDGLGLPSIARRSMGLLEDVVTSLRRMNQPVIAALNGPAVGGGFCLSLAADIRIAAPTTYFRAAGINNGLTASELGLSFMLPRIVGQGRASEIMLTGRDVDAEEARTIGLVSEIVEAERLLERANEIGERIASFSHAGIQMTKRSLWSSLDASSLESHMEAEGLAQLFLRLTTQNFEEAIRARRDKRTPTFEA
ncbi:MAG: enoyl-CoA hydratase [Actinomycetes bacterium]